jgi:eukaryotic-like serine/threonine-protein kinase
VGKLTSFGNYDLRSRLNAGGMAEVFRAIDTRTGRACALKRILPAVAEDEDFIAMFEDEARIASRLDHPNIARVIDFGSNDGTYFIAYELVDGVDLRVIFENASLTSEPLPLSFLLYVFVQIAEGLAYAHDCDVVHRDVSPHNIVVSSAGDVKLIDFGIAKAKGKLSRTGAGVIKGKLGYASPEQVRGATLEAPVDERSDVFSLGICMWELLTLKRLFFSAANEILVLDMVKRHVPEPPSAHRVEVAAELDRIVLKALAKNHAERYRSARKLTRDLEAFVSNSGSIEARATREDIGGIMRRTFTDDARRNTGSTMEPQETRMSDDNKSGSDLDIFEGLGKKSSARTSAAPPPPPGSSSHIPSGAAAAPLVPPPADTKRTLMGIPGPAQPPSQGSFPSGPPAHTPSAPPVSGTSASAMPSAPPASGGRISAPPPLPASASAPASGSMRAASPSTPSAPPGSPSKPPPRQVAARCRTSVQR